MTREEWIKALFYEDGDRHVFRYSDPRITLETDPYIGDLLDVVVSATAGWSWSADKHGLWRCDSCGRTSTDKETQ